MENGMKVFEEKGLGSTNFKDDFIPFANPEEYCQWNQIFGSGSCRNNAY